MRLALDIACFCRPWICTLYRTNKLEPLGEVREILKFARQQAKSQARNVNLRQDCIVAIEEGIVSGGLAGINKESVRSR